MAASAGARYSRCSNPRPTHTEVPATNLPPTYHQLTTKVLQTVADPEGGAEPFPSLVRVTLVEGRYHQVTRSK